VTILSLLKIAITKIERFDAELLLAYTLKTSREYIVTYPEKKVSFFQKYRFLSLVKKRASRIPLAYLTGQKNFFGLDFLVNKYTLVPRPDTEILVEKVLEELKNTSAKILIDIGTGSGCIPISIAKNTNQNIQFFATDISSSALKVAQKNTEHHNVNVQFLKGNLLEAILQKNISLQNIILTANLPYLTQKQFDEEKSIQKEPHSALVADDAGLALYKELLTQMQQHNVTGTFFFEIDPSQSHALSEYITKIFPNTKIQIIKDLCGRERVVQWSL
jgi:release factor glutamine methyltransferase